MVYHFCAPFPVPIPEVHPRIYGDLLISLVRIAESYDTSVEDVVNCMVGQIVPEEDASALIGDAVELQKELSKIWS